MHGKLSQVPSLLFRVVRGLGATEPESGSGNSGEKEPEGFPSCILLTKLRAEIVEGSSGIHCEWTA